MKKLPKNWYIEVTEENQAIVSKWRLETAGAFLHKDIIAVGMFVMSNHSDGSCYYGFDNEKELNLDFPSHVSIDFETFLEITEMKMPTYTVTREQFLQGYELACGDWQELLAKKFAMELLKSDTIVVEDSFAQRLRNAAISSTQIEFLDSLFVDPNLVQPKDLEIGEAMRIKEISSHYYDAVILRTFDGFVDVKNPRNTWSNIPTFRGVRVKLKIEVEEC